MSRVMGRGGIGGIAGEPQSSIYWNARIDSLVRGISLLCVCGKNLIQYLSAYCLALF